MLYKVEFIILPSNLVDWSVERLLRQKAKRLAVAFISLKRELGNGGCLNFCKVRRNTANRTPLFDWLKPCPRKVTARNGNQRLEEVIYFNLYK
ncbi:hypothetical protein MKY41_09765 [Sporosarcina sp. FSL W7-1349]|uniref:hypothetical protein n=1 Tax=Sporosarcina sp. FSL W7-1349 TaxID=2921561 RepID=UPI0030F5FFD8